MLDIAPLKVDYRFEKRNIIVSHRRARRFMREEDTIHFQPHNHRKEGVVRYHPHIHTVKYDDEEVVIFKGEGGKPDVTAKTGNQIERPYSYKPPPMTVTLLLGLRPAIIEMPRPELLAVLEGVLTEKMTFDWDYHNYPHLLWFFEQMDAKPKATVEEVKAIGATSRLMWIESESRRINNQLAAARAAMRIPTTQTTKHTTGNLFE